MELIILKDGKIFARANDPEENGEYSLATFNDAEVPPYPAEKPGKGKAWELVYTDGALSWELTERPLSPEERLEVMEERLDAIEYPPFVQPTGAHDAYKYGDKVTFNGDRYASIFDGANVWSPADYPEGWEKL